MDEVGIANHRHIKSGQKEVSSTDKLYLKSAELILIGGGDPFIG